MYERKHRGAFAPLYDTYTYRPIYNIYLLQGPASSCPMDSNSFLKDYVNVIDLSVDLNPIETEESPSKIEVNKSLEIISPYCFLCNSMYPVNLKKQDAPLYLDLFQTYTTVNRQAISMLLSEIVGEKVASNKDCSDLICRDCFSLLDHFDFILEDIIQTKRKICDLYKQNFKASSFQNTSSPSMIYDLNSGIPKADLPSTSLEDFHSSADLEKFGTSHLIAEKIFDNTSVITVKEDLITKEKPFLSTNSKTKLTSSINFLGNQEQKSTCSIQTTPPSSPMTTPYYCPNCKQIFKVILHLRFHLIEQHSVSLSQVDEIVLKCALTRISKLNEKDIQHSSTYAVDLSCSWCKEDYSSKTWAEYYDHLDNHFQISHKEYCKLVDTTGVENIICQLCSSNFKTVKSLETHFEKSHNESDENFCLLCRERCQGHAALLRHINHHILGNQKCTLCPTMHSSHEQNFSHLETYHNNKYFIKCIQCGENFKNYEMYKDHMTRHKTEHNYACAYSDASNSSLTKKFKCEECGNHFKNYGSLIGHQVEHIFGIYRCPHCHLKYSKVDKISKHLLNAHPDIKRLECKLCSNVYKTYKAYLRHLKLEHPSMSGGRIMSHNCNKCNKELANKVQLNRHYKLCHSKKKLFTCNICGAKVKHLDVHMNGHTKMKVYSCNECDVQYFSCSSLQQHIKRNHMGDSAKKHQCNVCDKLFVSPIDLKVHIARVHCGERNYRCEFCQKKYKSQSSLTYHRRRHTGEKPHQCGLCNAAFENPAFLKVHVEKYHKAFYLGTYKKTGKSKNSKAEKVLIDISKDMRKEIITLSSRKEESGTNDIIYVVN